jgi:hypothetical protein
MTVQFVQKMKTNKIITTDKVYSSANRNFGKLALAANEVA